MNNGAVDRAERECLMPCNALAVQQLRLEPKVAEELIASPQLAEALRAWLAQTLNSEIALEVENTWQHGHRGRAFEGDAYLRLTGVENAIVVTLSVANGIRLADYGNTGVSVETLEAFCTALVQAAAQERIVAALAEQYRITSDNPLSNGMRTLELEV